MVHLSPFGATAYSSMVVPGCQESLCINLQLFYGVKNILIIFKKGIDTQDKQEYY